MAEIATIARPYANAVFELAKERRAIVDWSKQLQLAAAVSAQPEILEIIESPPLRAMIGCHPGDQAA